MTEPIYGASPGQVPAKKRLHDRRTAEPVESLDEQTIAPFARWMDGELAKLEDRFQHLMTPRSFTRSLRR